MPGITPGDGRRVPQKSHKSRSRAPTSCHFQADARPPGRRADGSRTARAHAGKLRSHGPEPHLPVPGQPHYRSAADQAAAAGPAEKRKTMAAPRRQRGLAGRWTRARSGRTSTRSGCTWPPRVRQPGRNLTFGDFRAISSAFGRLFAGRAGHHLSVLRSSGPATRHRRTSPSTDVRRRDDGCELASARAP
jgi:hypothetical protein